jgi:hypothetical protein
MKPGRLLSSSLLHRIGNSVRINSKKCAAVGNIVKSPLLIINFTCIKCSNQKLAANFFDVKIKDWINIVQQHFDFSFFLVFSSFSAFSSPGVNLVFVYFP